MSITTSATYEAWRVMTTRLLDVSWPVPPFGDDRVAVWFGDPTQPNPDEDGNPPYATERVVVVGMINTPDMEWGAIGNAARMEQWTFPVFVESHLPGRTSSEARDRIEELTAEIEASLRLTQVGARTNTDQPEPFFKYDMWTWAVQSVKPLIFGGEAGYVGQAEVIIECAFRVNKPYRTL